MLIKDTGFDVYTHLYVPNVFSYCGGLFCLSSSSWLLPSSESLSEEKGKSSIFKVLSQKTVQPQTLKETAEYCSRASMSRESSPWLDSQYYLVWHPRTLNDYVNSRRWSYNKIAPSPIFPAASLSLSLPGSKWGACLLWSVIRQTNKKEWPNQTYKTCQHVFTNNMVGVSKSLTPRM